MQPVMLEIPKDKEGNGYGSVIPAFQLNLVELSHPFPCPYCEEEVSVDRLDRILLKGRLFPTMFYRTLCPHSHCRTVIGLLAVKCLGENGNQTLTFAPGKELGLVMFLQWEQLDR